MAVQRNFKIPINEGDYEVEGILHCGYCRTPKQIELDLGRNIIRPLAICKCMKEKLEEEERQEKERQRREKIEKMRNECFCESSMKGWNFTADDLSNKKIHRVALNYVENFGEMKRRGKGLLFFGGVGVGKTFYAAAIANALIDRNYACLMTNFSRLVNTLQGMYAGKQEYIDSLNKYCLLVIDDLAVERDTDYMNEIVYNIVDSRYRSGLPTIITTNLTDKEIQSPDTLHKQRLYSRILEMTIPIRVEGVDRRKEKLKADYKDLNELLGL